MGDEVDAFERELAELAGVPFAVAVSSGTDALLTSLMALGIGPGDEVVTSAFSFIAAAETIARLGATPVFADIGDDFNLDPESVRSRISARTRAIVPVDLFGRRANVEGLGEHGIALVEDAAQAIGARGVGHGVRAAALSFFPTKNLGALGDGGALLTDDSVLADAMRLLRAHGSGPKYVHACMGGNMRLDALQAAILRVKLPRVAQWNATRRGIARRYREELADVSGVALPADEGGHVWHQFVVRARPGRDGAPNARRDALRAHLGERDVETEVYYPLALHLQPCFAHLPKVHLPNAVTATSEAVALPVHPALGDDEVGHVIAALRSFKG